MNDTEMIKFNHEIFVCVNFLHIYNKSIHFLKHGDPLMREPDCICDRNTAIEIVGIYDSDKQAEKLWNNDLDIKTENIFSFDLLAFENLNKNISKKLFKLNKGLYKGFNGRVMLVCDILSPLVTDKDIDIFVKSYIPFNGNSDYEKYFYEIWILWKSNVAGCFRIKKLE